MKNQHTVSIRPAAREELHVIAALAGTIWPMTYAGILGADQIEYMLEMMYAGRVLEQEYDTGVRFFLIIDGDKAVGFFSFGVEGDGKDKVAKLHKLYLDASRHGQGIGSLALRRAAEEARRAGFRRMILDVNRNNARAIRAYERNGFVKREVVDIPIGNGFEMNDFIMEKDLTLSGRILSFGSLNLDLIYQLPHALHSGETLQSKSYRVGAGGKGANQSIAAARAGVTTLHIGRIGPEGELLRENLSRAGVNVSLLEKGSTPTGHAVILIDENGNNSIVLYPGANFEITPEQLDRVLREAAPGDILLLQNETNLVAEAIRRAHAAGIRVAFNFAPFDVAAVAALPLEQVDFLLVNEVEGAGLSGVSEPEKIVDELTRRYPGCTVVLTLGPDGALAGRDAERCRAASPPVKVVETTGAGDTFIGYFLSGVLRERSLKESLELGCRAAALSVSRPGAAESIPAREELETVFGTAKAGEEGRDARMG